MKVRVFRFRYWDRESKSVRLSEDYATEKAIEEMRAEPSIPDMRDVDINEITRSGLFKELRRPG